MNSIPFSAITDGAALETVVQVLFWSVFATGLLAGLLWLFDLITPGRLHKMVFVEKNQAASIIYAGVIVALAIIIASAMH
jgi:uncharacterized membrane protein YjfL (UPF0719 family)